MITSITTFISSDNTKLFFRNATLQTTFGFAVGGGVGAALGFTHAAFQTFFHSKIDANTNGNSTGRDLLKHSVDLSTGVSTAITSQLAVGLLNRYTVVVAVAAYVNGRLCEFFANMTLNAAKIENKAIREFVTTFANTVGNVGTVSTVNWFNSRSVYVSRDTRQTQSFTKSVKTTHQCSELTQWTSTNNNTLWIRTAPAGGTTPPYPLEIAINGSDRCYGLYGSLRGNPNFICFDPNPTLIQCSDGRTGIQMSSNTRHNPCFARREWLADDKAILDRLGYDLPLCNEPPRPQPTTDNQTTTQATTEQATTQIPTTERPTTHRPETTESTTTDQPTQTTNARTHSSPAPTTDFQTTQSTSASTTHKPTTQQTTHIEPSTHKHKDVPTSTTHISSSKAPTTTEYVTTVAVKSSKNIAIIAGSVASGGVVFIAAIVGGAICIYKCIMRPYRDTTYIDNDYFYADIVPSQPFPVINQSRFKLRKDSDPLPSPEPIRRTSYDVECSNIYDEILEPQPEAPTETAREAAENLGFELIENDDDIEL